jgi:hypothetical protein
MILKSLPDIKSNQFVVTVGKDYAIINTIGNGYVISTDDGKNSIIVLQSRFE